MLLKYRTPKQWSKNGKQIENKEDIIYKMKSIDQDLMVSHATNSKPSQSE